MLKYDDLVDESQPDGDPCLDDHDCHRMGVNGVLDTLDHATRCEYDSEAKVSDAKADVMCEKDLTIIYLTSLKAGQLGRRRQEAGGQPADRSAPPRPSTSPNSALLDQYEKAMVEVAETYNFYVSKLGEMGS